MITIEVKNPIYSICRDIKEIKDCLKYESEYWKQGPFCHKRMAAEAYLCEQRKGARNGEFLTGLIPHIEKYCNDKSIPYQIIQSKDNPIKLRKPSLPGIIFRDDQWDLIGCIRNNLRGVVVSPTGSGKTVLAAAVISMIPHESSAVFIVHTSSLFTQSIKEFQGWFGEANVGWLGDTDFNLSEFRKINVMMVQSVNNLLTDKKRKPPKPRKQKEGAKPPSARELERRRKEAEKRVETRLYQRGIVEEILGDCDALITDEVHHVTGEEGHYRKVFENCFAPVRIGMTATELKRGKAALVCEGLVGPIIGKFELQEGIAKGILAMPKLKLIPVPINPEINRMKTYKTIYRQGIVLNKARNRLIAKEIAAQVADGKSVLVMIQDVSFGHAEQIIDIAKSVYGIDVAYVEGATGNKEREKIKQGLESKQIMAAIATAVWREAINIKSLDCVINACGGKSEIMTLQAIGRGLRTTDGKTELILVDLLDPYDYVAQHTIQRLKIYVDNKWL
jgi:superfamily II DNA or RNA helicase